MQLRLLQQVDNHIKYIVGIQDNLYQIIFYQSKVTHRWWMEVPSANKEVKYERMYLIPCNAKDYETACRNELPERWLAAYQKLEQK